MAGFSSSTRSAGGFPYKKPAEPGEKNNSDLLPPKISLESKPDAFSKEIIFSS
jgi:hypothetical protein